jgi:tRNA modification GTPase
MAAGPTPLAGGDDTIVALATPAGRGALAVLRLGGPRAFAVASRVIAPWPLPAWAARLCELRHPDDGTLIDRAVVTAYEAPRSYTGEPMVEISTHGGLVVPATALAALIAAGAREALPGEFTRRAVVHGKMDVLQAEAIADLVDARSAAMQQAALRQLDGGLSRRVLALREQLLQLEALIAYDIDFPEEDDGPIAPARILEAADTVAAALDALLATAPAGELVREGALVVLAGAPNVGKSSLFNALLGRARAIVTPVPGTTRDALEAVVDAGGWPLRLVDTAGLREATDVVERLGIEVSEEYLARAQVVLACGETPASLAGTIARVRAHSTAPVVAALTKSDLVTDRNEYDRGTLVAPGDEAPLVRVSAETGEGLRELVEAIAGAVERAAGGPVLDAPVLTRARHERALRRARDEVAAFRRGWTDDALPAPVAAVHLREAVGELEGLIGAVDVEDVLDRVFASFCVGK